MPGGFEMTVCSLQKKTFLAFVVLSGSPFAFASVNSPAVQSVEGKAARMIASAARKLGQGSFAAAERDLLAARGQSSDLRVRNIWLAVMSDVKESQGQWAEAAYYARLALSEYAKGIGVRLEEQRRPGFFWNMTTRRLVVRSIKNFVLAELPVEAFVQFRQFEGEFYREYLSVEESVLFKRVAEELKRVGRSSDAGVLERVVFRYYPLVPPEVLESLSPVSVCQLDDDQQSLKNKRARGSLLIQRFGAQPFIKGYALSLSGVPALFSQLNEKSVESLSDFQKEEILETIEWLQTIREYPTALELTSKLVVGDTFEIGFARERLMMLHARNLNGVHRPVEAASIYQDLMAKSLQTENAKTVRYRLIQSLHYAGQYDEAARIADSLHGFLRPKDMAWRTFWARYLSKQYALAISSTAHGVAREQRARFQYWRGRAYESEGRMREAKDLLSSIASIDGANHYALFADWRLSPPIAQPVFIQQPSVAFAARNLMGFENNGLSVIRSKQKIAMRYQDLAPLLETDYTDLLKGHLRGKLQSLGKSGDELAEFMIHLNDGHASVQFASNQRKNIAQIPLGQKGEWKKYLAKHGSVLKLLYPLPYRETVADAAENFSISPWLVLSIMRAESLFQPQIVSSVGARGLMQIMPATGERIAELMYYPDFEPSQLDQPDINITFGSWYLARLLDYYRGHLPLAIAAYNAGPEAIDRWLARNRGMNLDEFLEDIPFEQTRKYVATVLSNMEIYSRLYSGGSTGIRVNLRAALPIPRKDMEMF